MLRFSCWCCSIFTVESSGLLKCHHLQACLFFETPCACLHVCFSTAESSWPVKIKAILLLHLRQLAFLSRTGSLYSWRKCSNRVCGWCTSLNLNLRGLRFFCLWPSHQSCWGHQRWSPQAGRLGWAGATAHPESGLQVSVCLQPCRSLQRWLSHANRPLEERGWCSKKNSSLKVNQTQGNVGLSWPGTACGGLTRWC